MAYSYKDNAQLIKDLQKGNELAYTYLVNTFHKPLFIYALNLCNDHDMAEDITQDVFIKTWEFRLRLKSERKIKNFLYKIAYNEFVNLYHRKQMTSALNKIYIEALNEAVDDSHAALLPQKIAILKSGIEALPHKCKEVFLLSKKDGLTNVEISEYLNISMKTVEGHIRRAYLILREELGQKLKAILFLLFGRTGKI
ncbi:RNA polymerase sigma factor [Aestuariivivens sediminis]|uniref:RNA polymerase sigma factor n=1 Tax=Aestuariivivens sediminis TaxID=2913557 RepID=UPI001F58AFEC|nr:sigma-70 family RNA polymerase sigma factor [Aestuariivivens sediminis]